MKGEGGKWEWGVESVSPAPGEELQKDDNHYGAKKEDTMEGMEEVGDEKEEEQVVKKVNEEEERQVVEAPAVELEKEGNLYETEKEDMREEEKKDEGVEMVGEVDDEQVDEQVEVREERVEEPDFCLLSDRPRDPEDVPSLLVSAVQCRSSAVQCSAVQCSAVQHSN
jgi:hypothetical protein